MKENKTTHDIGTDDRLKERGVDLTVQVPADLYRAYHRCCWIINHETGRDRKELAQEMVTDFLIKNGC